MSRPAQALTLIGMMFVASQAHAVDSASPPPVGKRQMIVQMVDCMKKRMSADKSRSYNEAMKACKDEISKEKDESPSGALVASETQPKQ